MQEGHLKEYVEEAALGEAHGINNQTAVRGNVIDVIHVYPLEHPTSKHLDLT